MYEDGVYTESYLANLDIAAAYLRERAEQEHLKERSIAPSMDGMLMESVAEGTASPGAYRRLIRKANFVSAALDEGLEASVRALAQHHMENSDPRTAAEIADALDPEEDDGWP